MRALFWTWSFLQSHLFFFLHSNLLRMCLFLCIECLANSGFAFVYAHDRLLFLNIEQDTTLIGVQQRSISWDGSIEVVVCFINLSTSAFITWCVLHVYGECTKHTYTHMRSNFGCMKRKKNVLANEHVMIVRDFDACINFTYLFSCTTFCRFLPRAWISMRMLLPGSRFIATRTHTLVMASTKCVRILQWVSYYYMHNSFELLWVWVWVWTMCMCMCICCVWVWVCVCEYVCECECVVNVYVYVNVF